MGKTNLIGQPVNFFTRMDYENYSDPLLNDIEDYMGEYQAEIHYDYVNFKTGKNEYGIAFHNDPYFPADIEAADYAVNVISYGDGDYSIDKTISYTECLQIFNELLSSGVPMMDITADTIREKLHGKAKVA